jgi:hypothetical protein
MVHRGPDHEGYGQSPLAAGGQPAGPAAGTVGFGFRRLAILGLSPAGHQPMVHPETGDCLPINGEIYNFRQPRAELQCAGVHVRSTGRPKTGFTLPIGDWMRGPMREPCAAAIECLASQAFIDAAEVGRTWQSFLADPRAMHWSRPLALVVLGGYLEGQR